ncbi:MAG: hypothetical protein IPL79_13795 [Myxococcales bacterium]|nr:hypothetical protein [Myxococcales bacterium]
MTKIIALRNLLPSILASLIATSSLTACGSNDGGGYSVDTSKPLNTLTEAEQLTLCEEFRDNSASATTEGLRRLACVLEATDFDSSECSATDFEACMDEPLVPVACEPFDANDAEATCSATAAAYLDCLDAYASQFAQFADLTCTSGGSGDDLLSPDDLPACDALLAACPDVSID